MSSEPEGGEALADEANWYALWTHSHCEQLVQSQLMAKGYEAFLPRLAAWKRRGSDRWIAYQPMFPGYLFLRHAMNKVSYIDIMNSRGLVRVLGDRWDRLAAIPQDEIEAISTLIESGMPALPYPYLKAGQRVRIVAGVLAGVEGSLVETKAGKGMLVISVELLQRSVAVEIDCTLVATI